MLKISAAEKDCRERDYRVHFVGLTFLMMLDYFLTWVGIHVYGVITEGNPFMVWMFNLPFHLSLMARMALVSILVGMCVWLYHKNYRRFNTMINFCILSNVLVLYAHVYWINQVITYMH